MATCVDDIDFGVDSNGRLYKRTHASKMLNDVAIRIISSHLADNNGAGVYEETIGGYDTVDYTYGTAITAQPGNGRFVINSPGIYHVSIGQGDNDFEANRGATLGLALLVGGTTRLNVTDDREETTKHFLNVAGDVEIPAAGTTLRVLYHVELPLSFPRLDHYLYPNNRNFFAVHRVGGLR